MTQAFAHLSARLQQQRTQQRYRNRRPIAERVDNRIKVADKWYLSFASNDYLGLSQHPKIIAALQQSAAKFGIGSTSSSLIAGYTIAHQDAEQAYAEFLGRDRALLFGNGYMANLGIITAIASNREDSIYQDKLNHASLIDAALLSRGQLKRYRHNDFNHLNEMISTDLTPLKLIISESIFSMDGTAVNLGQLASISQRHNALFMVDDAHGIGVIGPKGQGAAAQYNLDQNALPILSCPLGKALGCYGAIVAGSDLVIESILQFARTYIYTTAVPPALAHAALCALMTMQVEYWRQEKLMELIHYFRQQALNHGFELLPSEHAIQILIIGDSAKALRLSEKLLAHGIYLPAIRPPTVAEGSARLRISLNALHTHTEIDRLLNLLKEHHHAE